MGGGITMKKNKYAIIKYAKEIKSKKELFESAATYAEESEVLAKFTNLKDAKKYLSNYEGSCTSYRYVINYYNLIEYALELIEEDDAGDFTSFGILRYAQNPTLKKELKKS